MTLLYNDDIHSGCLKSVSVTVVTIAFMACESAFSRRRGQKIQSVYSPFSSRLPSSSHNFPSSSNDPAGYAGCVSKCPIQDYSLPGDHIPAYLWQGNCVQTIL